MEVVVHVRSQDPDKACAQHAAETDWVGCGVARVRPGTHLYLGSDPQPLHDTDPTLCVDDETVSETACRLWIDELTKSVLVMNLSTTGPLVLSRLLPLAAQDQAALELAHRPEREVHTTRPAVGAVRHQDTTLFFGVRRSGGEVAAFLEMSDDFFAAPLEVRHDEARHLQGSGTVLPVRAFTEADAERVRAEDEHQRLVAELRHRPRDQQLKAAMRRVDADRRAAVAAKEFVADGTVGLVAAYGFPDLLGAFLNDAAVVMRLEAAGLGSERESVLGQLRREPTRIHGKAHLVVNHARAAEKPKARRVERLEKQLGLAPPPRSQRGGAGHDHAQIIREVLRGYDEQAVRAHLVAADPAQER